MNDQIITETINMTATQPKPEDQITRALKAAASVFFAEVKPLLINIIRENAPTAAEVHDEVVDTLSGKMDDLLETRQFERRINELAESAIDNYDFSGIVERGIEDYHFDFSDEVSEGIDNYDFSSIVESAIDEAVTKARNNPDHPLAKMVRAEIRAYFEAHSFNVTPT